jgi:hypothetical protein
MPLSSDQRALLRLLLDGEDYVAIAELVGDDSDAVRKRAHEALRAAEESEPALAAPVRDRLAQLEGSAPPPAPAGTPRSGGRRLAFWLPLAIGAVAVAAIILVIGGGSDDDSTTGTTTGPSPDEDVVVIDLKPVSGASAKGSARLIRIEDVPALDIDVIGLEPSSPEDTYIVWLYNSRTEAFPLVFLDVGANGRLEGRAPVPAAATSLLASFDGLDVSLARKDVAAAAIQQAVQGSGIPRHVGQSVVRGKFPRGGDGATDGQDRVERIAACAEEAGFDPTIDDDVESGATAIDLTTEDATIVVHVFDSEADAAAYAPQSSLEAEQVGSILILGGAIPPTEKQQIRDCITA